MIAILIAIILAAVAYYICIALGLPYIIAIIAALLVLLAGIGYTARGPRGPTGPAI